MRYRVVFVAGFVAGFILGARAGRERYEQIKRLARRIMDNPAVQQTAGALQAQAGEFAQTARQKVGGKLQDKVPRLRSRSAGNGEAFTSPSATPDGSPARH